MLRANFYRESGHRVSFCRLLLFSVLILICQQAMAGRLFSRTVHGTAAAAVHARDFIGGIDGPRSGRCDSGLRSTILHLKTAFGLILDVLSAALASAGVVMLTTAAIIALRRRPAACDLFSLEEMRRSCLDSAIGGCIGSFAAGAGASLSAIVKCWNAEIDLALGVVALALFGISRSGIPARIESAKLDQLSNQVDELSREIAALGRSSTRPNAAGGAL